MDYRKRVVKTTSVLKGVVFYFGYFIYGISLYLVFVTLFVTCN